MRQLYSLSLAFFLIQASIAVPAAAECTDVMSRDGFSPEQISGNTFLRNVAFAYLKTARYEDRDDKEVLGGTFPAAEAILGARYGRQDYEAFQKTLHRFDLTAFAEADDIAISSGDEDVTAAWMKCMKTRTGLILRFKPYVADPARAVLTLQWSSADAHAPRYTRLTESLVLPEGVKFVSGQSCFERYSKVTESGCAAIVKSQSRKTPVLALLNTEDGPVQAYWAPRLQLELQRATYDVPMVTPEQSFTRANYYDPPRTVSFAMSKTVAAAGWAFAPSTVRVGHKMLSGNAHAECNSGESTATDHSVSISFNAENLSSSAPQTLVCVWRATAQMFRTVDQGANEKTAGR